MTPPDIIAEAIAALEKTVDIMQRAALESPAGWFVREWEETIVHGRATLASLRAVAPAPADQSDAGRDGVAKAIWEVAHPNPPGWAAWGDRSGFGPSIPERKLTLEQADAAIRALTAAPAETVGRGEFPLYDAGLFGDWGGGNVEWWHDYLREELGRSHDFYRERFEHRPIPTADRDAIREALKDAREFVRPKTWADSAVALASAPSETVGREDSGWKCGADRYGVDPQDCNWPYCGCDPLAEKVMTQLAEHGWHTPDEVRNLLLQIPSAADRDAMRETFLEARDFLRNPAGLSTSVMINRITAALALIGEG